MGYRSGSSGRPAAEEEEGVQRRVRRVEAEDRHLQALLPLHHGGAEVAPGQAAKRQVGHRCHNLGAPQPHLRHRLLLLLLLLLGRGGGGGCSPQVLVLFSPSLAHVRLVRLSCCSPAASAAAWSPPRCRSRSFEAPPAHARSLLVDGPRRARQVVGKPP